MTRRGASLVRPPAGEGQSKGRGGVHRHSFWTISLLLICGVRVQSQSEDPGLFGEAAWISSTAVNAASPSFSGPPSDDYADVGSGESGKGGGAGATSSAYGPLIPGAGTVCQRHRYLPPRAYEMLADSHTRQLGLYSPGDRSRLLAALQRYAEGGNLTIAVAGGSVAAGQGAVDAPAFPYWIERILRDQLPGAEVLPAEDPDPALDPSGQGQGLAEGEHGGDSGADSGTRRLAARSTKDSRWRVVVNNGGVPGTTSQYMSSCHNVHVPQRADVVILEYAINDGQVAYPVMNNEVRRAYERLIRKLLRYPRRPAVVLFHTFRWFWSLSEQGRFYSGADREHAEFGSYYHLPQLSVKACCYHLMLQGRPGFQVHRPRAAPGGKRYREPGVDEQLKGKVWFYDVAHPDGNTGHRVMGELAAQLILDAHAMVAAGHRLSAAEAARVEAPLPPPMLESNLESAADRCFVGPSLTKALLDAQGFEWVNEGKNPKLPKWGYVASQPGAVLRLKLATATSAGTEEERGMNVSMQLGFLHSYEHMGRAAVSCEDGCACDPWVLDGHTEVRNSQTLLSAFPVTQASECVVRVEVLQNTSSGGHKVKLTGLMVSDDPYATGFTNTNGFYNWLTEATGTDGVVDARAGRRRQLAALLAAEREEEEEGRVEEGRVEEGLQAGLRGGAAGKDAGPGWGLA
ncbi:hypothetical protein HYH03_012702 [Edaphochlamys debaryana]|uniref:SGNH hydrolase-type esterase domain-containing protein n=1 Tax=Edaphochlamys debaryana TaxID=47281 RepID=A0A835XPH9_9CHLO|nr:hypothetical protein HYH03_012702 [Edaphochlamys debaryana]|eukprot:KAG2488702.1 hypothetical protein HYH03_012702 [Edaphochlamys debaryana]